MVGDERRIIAGRYELTLPIGRGGMGEVWAGYDRRLDRRVAVKLLRRDLFAISDTASGDRAASGADVIRRRFAREARTTARVDHAGVPAVFDAGVDNGELYLVMQLMSGVPLSDVLAESESAMPIGAIAAVGAQLASVLAAAHAVSLVHRDLKPSNVLIEDTGQVTVLDFGVAALLDPERTQLTAGGETLGSPAYMAPEQVVHAQVSPRADLYSLGCVLYEMLTGSSVFDGGTSFALMQAHVDRTPTPPSQVRPEVPDDLNALTLELLAKDPAQRPAHARVVYERLVSHVTAETHGSQHRHDPTRPFRFPFAPPQVDGSGHVPPTETVPRSVPGPEGPETDAAGAVDIGAVDIGAVDVDIVRNEAADLLDAGQHTQATDLLRRALAMLNRRDPSGRDATDLRLTLANAYLVAEDFAAALPLYEAVHPQLSTDAALDAYCRHQIAVCRAAMGDTARALAEFHELLDLQTQRVGTDYVDTVEIGRQIVLLMASSGDVSGATARLDELISNDPSGELQALRDHLHRLES